MAIRVSSAHYGWLANVRKDGSLSWTKHKAGAAFQERYHVSPVPMDRRIAGKYKISGKAAS